MKQENREGMRCRVWAEEKSQGQEKWRSWREEGHLAAVPGPGRTEGNVPCHREMKYPQ